jgi:multiple sugar transport system substrate-binding protein
MVDGIKDGVAPKDVITYMETESRDAFLTGKPAFLRTWPGDYSLIVKGSNTKGKVAVAPFPEFEGGGKAGILGGHNMVVSVYSTNPGGSLKFIDFATKPDSEKIAAVKFAVAPVLNETYDDPDVKKAMPFAAQLKDAVGQAKSRPVSEVYPQISQAIYENVNQALSGRVSPEDAMKTAQDQMEKAIATF